MSVDGIRDEVLVPLLQDFDLREESETVVTTCPEPSLVSAELSMLMDGIKDEVFVSLVSAEVAGKLMSDYKG